MINNMHSYQFVSDVHNRDTRQGCNFNIHQPSAHRALYFKEACCMDIRIINNLPVSIKKLYNNPIAFKRVLNKFLCEHSFYTLDEYFNYRHNNNDVTGKRLFVMFLIMFDMRFSNDYVCFLFIFLYGYYHILNVQIYGM
jgi:hypothetical protein